MTPYVSIDIETTALKPHPNNVLSIALVVDTCDGTELSDLPSLKIMFLHTPANYEDTAVSMNSSLFSARALAKGHLKIEKMEGLLGKDKTKATLRIHDNYAVVPNWTAAEDLIREFVKPWERLEVAGKNIASFDWNFLPSTVKEQFTPTFHDPGVLFKTKLDKYKPSMAECCRRAKLPEIVTHDAYDDAIQVISLLRYAREVENLTK